MGESLRFKRVKRVSYRESFGVSLLSSSGIGNGSENVIVLNIRVRLRSGLFGFVVEVSSLFIETRGILGDVLD